LMPRIKDLILDCFLSVRSKMNPNNRKNVFELFGFDFLIDEDFRIWLIEVNTNPFLGCPCPFMKDLVPAMVNDMIKLCVDPVFAPRTVPEEDRENDFELVYREQGPHGPAVNVRRPFSLDLVYPIPELRPFIGKKSALKEKQPRMPVRLAKAGTDKEGQITDSEQPKEEKARSEATPALGAPKRSLSHATRKPVFNMRRSRGSANSSKDRGQSSDMRRDGVRSKKLVADGDGIAENIAEEDRLSGEGSEEEVAYGTRSRVKKNLLCKNLLD